MSASRASPPPLITGASFEVPWNQERPDSNREWRVDLGAERLLLGNSSAQDKNPVLLGTPAVCKLRAVMGPRAHGINASGHYII